MFLIFYNQKNSDYDGNILDYKNIAAVNITRFVLYWTYWIAANL